MQDRWHPDDREWLAHRFVELLRGIGCRFTEINERLDNLVSSVDNLVQADADLKAEVVTFLQDIQSALSGDNPNVDQVVSDIDGVITQLQGADPAPPAAS